MDGEKSQVGEFRWNDQLFMKSIQPLIATMSPWMTGVLCFLY